MDQQKVTDYMNQYVQPMLNPLIHALLHSQPTNPHQFACQFLNPQYSPLYPTFLPNPQSSRIKRKTIHLQDRPCQFQPISKKLTEGERARVLVAMMNDSFFGQLQKQRIQQIISKANWRELEVRYRITAERLDCCIVLVRGRLKTSSLQKTLLPEGVYFTEFLVQSSLQTKLHNKPPQRQLLALDNCFFLQISRSLFRTISRQQSQQRLQIITKALQSINKDQLMPHKMLVELAGQAQLLYLQKQAINENEDGGYVVLEGCIKVYREEGSDWIFEDEIRKGQFFGRIPFPASNRKGMPYSGSKLAFLAKGKFPLKT